MPDDQTFTSPPHDWDRSGLPGWTYFNEELLELEIEELFRKRWQLACHVNEVPNPGDYTTFDIASERAIIVRGQDGLLGEVVAGDTECVAEQDGGETSGVGIGTRDDDDAEPEHSDEEQSDGAVLTQ